MGGFSVEIRGEKILHRITTLVIVEARDLLPAAADLVVVEEDQLGVELVDLSLHIGEGRVEGEFGVFLASICKEFNFEWLVSLIIV